MNVVSRAFVVLLSLTYAGALSAQGEQALERAVSVVKAACLASKQLDMRVDAVGNITLSRLPPGADESVVVNARESSSNEAALADGVRKLWGNDVHDCVKPYLASIFKTIIAVSLNPATKSSAILLDDVAPRTDSGVTAQLFIDGIYRVDLSNAAGEQRTELSRIEVGLHTFELREVTIYSVTYYGHLVPINLEERVCRGEFAVSNNLPFRLVVRVDDGHLVCRFHLLAQ